MLATHPIPEAEVGTLPCASLPLYPLDFLGYVHVQSERSQVPCSHVDGGAHAAFLLGMLGLLRYVTVYKMHVSFSISHFSAHVFEDKRLPAGVPQRLTISGVALTLPLSALFMYLSILMPASKEPRR